VSLILATIFSAAALAQTSPSPPPQPVAAAAETKTQGRHVNKHDGKQRKDDPKKDNPDPALLGFLGDYEDAADGLDPIGLSEQADADADKPKEGRRP
jgi:hypothetical protein